MGLSCALCVSLTHRGGSGASMQECPQRKQLAVGALCIGGGAGAPAEDLRRGGLCLLCAEPLQRAGKYNKLVL